MARQPRLALPGIPLHVVQRGVNRVRVFADDADRLHYLALLSRALKRHAVSLHAYVLMDNHVHLLLSCPATHGISLAMHGLGVSYVHAFNRRHDRVGTLWQGRFKSCLVDTDEYLLMVYRYIELNPVRAGLVRRAEDHPWSSVHANLGLRRETGLTPHPTFAALGHDNATRSAAYRRWLEAGLTPDELSAVRSHLAQQRALGAAGFHRELQRTLRRPTHLRPQGRPKKGTGTVNSN
jgi:putative transposase